MWARTEPDLNMMEAEISVFVLYVKLMETTLVKVSIYFSVELAVVKYVAVC